MKFKFIISKWANFYFFVSNLSEWHFSNRKGYNVFWRKELGSFSLKEKKSLRQFKSIRRLYKTTKTIFEQAFFISQNPWQKLENNLPAEEYKFIKQIFQLLENKFDLLWNKDEQLLMQWQKELDNKINEPQLIKSIVDILSIIFYTSPSEKEINIYLLFSSPIQTGGGANIDNKSIALEISRQPIQNQNKSMGIIWHETTHLCFQNQYFYPLLIECFPKNQQIADFINELSIASLFPRGMLGIRLLKNKPAAKLSPNINAKQTIELLNLTKEYLDQKKYFDKDYIEKISLIIKGA